jgi:hypothetical protein
VLDWATSNTGLRGSVYVRGCTINGSGTGNCPTVGALSSGKATFDTCTISQTSSGFIQLGVPNNGLLLNRFINCAITFAGASANTVSAIIAGLNHRQEYSGCTITARAGGQTHLFRMDSTNGVDLEFRGCTFANTVTNLFDMDVGDNPMVVFDGCVMLAFTNVFDTAPTHYRGRVEIHGAVAGTISAPVVGPKLITDTAGTIASDLTRWRDTGADDGENANGYSWAITGNANALDFDGYIVCPPITRKVAAGASQVVTVFVASGVTLQDEEFWIEVDSPSEAGSPTAASAYRSTRRLPLAAAANLTTDGASTWNGAGVTTKQKCSVTISPTVAGFITVRVFLAKASTAVYVDPIIDIDDDTDGSSAMAEGVQSFDPSEGSVTINQTVLVHNRKVVR